MSRTTSLDTLQTGLQELIRAAHRLQATAGRVTPGDGPVDPPAAPSASDPAGAARSNPPAYAAPELVAAEEPVADLVGLTLTPSQRMICERVINVFETGSVRGDYAAIAIFHDGPNGIRQITYGRSQTTEYGNLRELVQMYVEAGGRFAEDMRPFVPLIGRTALVDHSGFKQLLRRAGSEDPVMRDTQDRFFERRYFQPAMRWASDNGFTRALSALVIYDSFIHSGSIRDFLRARFEERPPARGGREQVWIREYVRVRHDWLATHPNPVLRPTIYRTRDMMREIDRGNWDLAGLPIMANGVPVDDRPLGGQSMTGMVAAATPGSDDIPYFGNAAAADLLADPGSQPSAAAEADPAAEMIWGDGGAALVDVGATFAAPDSAPALAGRILANPRIQPATGHVSGVEDMANARQNLVDTAAGNRACRSSYGTAPGGTVALDTRLLSGILALADEFGVSISELAGGSHNPSSRHYVGVAVDFNRINGRPVGASHPDLPAFKQLCRDLGVTELRAPGDLHHDTHVHAAWPRPA